MVEILPIRLLTDEDGPIFGSLNIALGKLLRAGIPVAAGIAVTPPNLKLKTVLEHFDFGAKEVFEQSLTLVKKEIRTVPVPKQLLEETGQHKKFFLDGEEIKSIKNLWVALLDAWLDRIKQRLYSTGFYQGITEGLDPEIVIFVKKAESIGTAYFDPLQDDVEVLVKEGKLHPNDLKKIVEIVNKANKKLFIPHEYRWILDRGMKLTKVLPYTPSGAISSIPIGTDLKIKPREAKSAIKVFFDLSGGFIIEKNIDGVYIDSGKTFDLNRPDGSFEDLVFKIVESAMTFSESPIFVKLADKSEGPSAGRAGMGKVRGALRLLHQQNLFNPLVEAISFARHKKNLNNVHVIVPFVRGVSELLQIKKELADRKLVRKKSLQIWMELAIPENLINLEEYLAAGVDGVVLNLNELVAYLNGFDPLQEDLSFYKNEVEGMIKFLEDGVRLLHKSKVPFMACGSLTFNPKVLEFLVEKGIYGIVAERFEAHSAHDLLNQVEKRMILKRV